jgi:predicted ribosome quality control (RQC) complex YloA/Tae2 family protein
MDRFFLAGLVDEIKHLVEGRALARLSVNPTVLFIDLRLPNGAVLAFSFDPSQPGFFLCRISFNAKDIDWRVSHPFAALARKRLVGAQLLRLAKPGPDRIVQLQFENYDPSGKRLASSLILTLTGRTSNAYLTDSDHRVEARLLERGPYREGVELDQDRMAMDPLTPIAETDGSIAKQNAESYFAAAGILGPSLKSEFEARCEQMSPAQALRSIDAELSDRSVPLVYSRVPLEEMGAKLVDLKRDLILSRIELVSARTLLRYEFSSLSEAADEYYLRRRLASSFVNEYVSLKRSLTDQIQKRQDLKEAIEADRVRFHDPDRLKRCGDLILANLSSAQIRGSLVRVLDFYDPHTQEVEIEIDSSRSLQQNASDYFARYQKARRAITAIDSRLAAVESEQGELTSLLAILEAQPSRPTVERIQHKLQSLRGKASPIRGARRSNRRSSSDQERQLGRRFISTDGYVIVVGRNDRENDWLTFRMARSQDIWMHAADYPGSHVVIKNPERKPVPQRTIEEAAELAAFYSQAKRESKAAVHFTEKKSVSKPPRAKPGLVRLSSFKTIMVQPKGDLNRLE